jgi:hypothetical protein
VAVLVALDDIEHQVSNVEGVTPNPTAMVPAQGLLVLGVEESDIAGFIELVQGILEELLGL